MVDSNAANVRRLQDLQGFQRIYAPFDGVIASRSVEPGSTVSADAELLTIVDTSGADVTVSGTSGTQTIDIADNDSATVSITANDPAASETGSSSSGG